MSSLKMFMDFLLNVLSVKCCNLLTSFEVLHSLWLSTGVRFEVFCLNVLCIVSLRRRFPLDCSCSAFDLRHVTTENVMFDFLPIFLQALV